MNTEMNGKQISKIWWINDYGDSCIEAKGQKTLMLSATYHGDRDEFWVIEYDDMQEVARHNCRDIATITWA
jgi:hypothetical protein